MPYYNNRAGRPECAGTKKAKEIKLTAYVGRHFNLVMSAALNLSGSIHDIIYAEPARRALIRPDYQRDRLRGDAFTRAGEAQPFLCSRLDADPVNIN